MSEFDFEVLTSSQGLLEVNEENNNPCDLYLNEHLGKIDNELLEGLVQQLSYGAFLQERGWINGFGKVGWSKSF
jgi:hypothetical protein